MTLVCAQRHRESYPVHSGSSSKTYEVTMFRDNELPACKCVGFMTKRNKNANIVGGGYSGAGTGLAKTTAAWCKHLQEVKDTTCDWEQQPGQQAQVVCPKCGGPVIDKSARRLPPGRGSVSPAMVPAATPARSALGAVRRTPKPKPATPPALPDPKSLITMMQDLAGTPADAPVKTKPSPEQARKTFEQITGKVAPAPEPTKPAPKAKPEPATDIDAAAAELARLLQGA